MQALPTDSVVDRLTWELEDANACDAIRTRLAVTEIPVIIQVGSICKSYSREGHFGRGVAGMRRIMPSGSGAGRH